MLDVGDGQHIYWEVSGNREGKPVVFLHGGPGAGTTPAHRRLFDPERYRIVLFDQRGCGLSIPHASEPGADLSANTTWHLVADMERLRAPPRHRPLAGLRRLVGQRARARVRADAPRARHRARAARHLHAAPPGARLVLRGRRVGDVPRPVGGLHRADPACSSAAHLIEAYGRLLADPDPEVHEPAAIAWSRWESSTITLLPQADTIARFTEPEYATAFARIENHYFRHGGWWEEGQLIRDASRLARHPRGDRAGPLRHVHARR